MEDLYNSKITARIIRNCRTKKEYNPETNGSFLRYLDSVFLVGGLNLPEKLRHQRSAIFGYTYSLSLCYIEKRFIKTLWSKMREVEGAPESVLGFW
jgi:hypothetical protein